MVFFAFSRYDIRGEEMVGAEAAVVVSHAEVVEAARLVEAKAFQPVVADCLVVSRILIKFVFVFCLDEALRR